MSTTILNTCTRPTSISGNSHPVHQSVLKATAQLDLLKYLLSKGCPSELALEIITETDRNDYVVMERYEVEKQIAGRSLQVDQWRKTEQSLLDLLNYRQNNTSSVIMDLTTVLNKMSHRSPHARSAAKNILKRVIADQVRINSGPMPQRTMITMTAKSPDGATGLLKREFPVR